MDQQLLYALNNLSVALEQISDALDKGKNTNNNSNVTNALVKGDFIDQIKGISEGVINIKKDTEEILKNQQTIIGLQNKRDGDKKAGVFDETGSDPKKENQLKKGVGTILLIAVAVLAIGMAFKLVGDVNILSVLTLGIGIMMVASVFEKVSKLKLSIGEVLIASEAIIIFSIAMTISSFILSAIRPISFSQAITAIFIAGVFTIVSFGMKRIIETFGSSIGSIAKAVVFMPLILPAIALSITLSSWILNQVSPIGLTQAISSIFIAGIFTVISLGLQRIISSFGGNPKNVAVAALFLPIILPAISLAIAISSYALDLVKPISFTKALTSILIAGLFAVISISMKRILHALNDKDANPKTALLAPLLLGAMSVAIMASSWALAEVKPMSVSQFLTSLAISILFIPIAFSIGMIAKPIRKYDMGDVFKLPILFTAMSLAIMLSSHILGKAKPLDFMFMLKIGVMGAILGVIAMIMSPTIKLMSKLKDKDVARLPIILPVIAASIMVSSWLLEKTANISVGKSLQILAFGASLGIITYGLGKAMDKLGKAGLKNIITGGIAVLAIAGTIMLSSHIISKGEYSKSKAPSLDWAKAVGLTLLTFGGTIVGTGLLIAATGGLGALALVAGAASVLAIAGTIVESSHILAKGNYKKGPTVEWASAVSMTLGAFMPIYKMLMLNGILKLFGGGVSEKSFNNVIRTISEGIIFSASIFSKSPGVWKKGPSKEWAEGVGTAISTFSPLYGILMAQNLPGIFKGPTIESFKNAITTISHGIVDAAGIFASSNAKFREGNYPSVNWGKGVGAALSAFAPVFKSLDGAWFSSGDEVIGNMRKGILYLTHTIIRVARTFEASKVSWSVYPDRKWAMGIRSSVSIFTGISKDIDESGYNFINANKMKSIANNMVYIAKQVDKNKNAFNTKIDPNFMKSLGSNLMYYMKLSNYIDKANGGMKGLVKDAVFGDPISRVSNGMIKLALAYDRLAKSLKNFSGSIQSIDASKLNSFRKLTGNIAVLSALDSKMFDNMLDVLDKKSSVFGNLLKEQAPKVEQINTKSKSGKTDYKNTLDKSKSMSDKKLSEIADLLKVVVKNIDGLHDYINRTSDDEIGK